MQGHSHTWGRVGNQKIVGIYGELNGNHLKDLGSGFHSHITQQLHGDIMKTCLNFQLVDYRRGEREKWLG